MFFFFAIQNVIKGGPNLTPDITVLNGCWGAKIANKKITKVYFRGQDVFVPTT